ncbi:uncharacterized protein GGS22DRAFT_27309 [Annulohypoxylon maeteangense]|uniref:uncharacterized protein n=1 Tax=Annulohypoxylon maeteangense TaxID=1927788 RepID=UPI002007E8D2|nr:uncharacterized protein GGS22DRAFT_27309 [Annulohypoxylon maeteangense]KAI0883907.1 hypothetical protein GGS22DRAFT_27309 [Annulohypoxylon maeteangense]
MSSIPVMSLLLPELRAECEFPSYFSSGPFRFFIQIIPSYHRTFSFIHITDENLHLTAPFLSFVLSFLPSNAKKKTKWYNGCFDENEESSRHEYMPSDTSINLTRGFPPVFFVAPRPPPVLIPNTCTGTPPNRPNAVLINPDEKHLPFCVNGREREEKSEVLRQVLPPSWPAMCRMKYVYAK